MAPRPSRKKKALPKPIHDRRTEPFRVLWNCWTIPSMGISLKLSVYVFYLRSKHELLLCSKTEYGFR